MSTDMSSHFDIMGAFSSTVLKITKSGSVNRQRSSVDQGAAGGTKTGDKFFALDKASQILSLKVAMKIADVGHCVTPFDVHHQWSQRLEDEFFRQGDAENALGVAISPLMDRSKTGVNYPSNQIGFLDVIIVPMLESFVQVFPGAALLLEKAKTNREEWQKRAEEPFAEV